MFSFKYFDDYKAIKEAKTKTPASMEAFDLKLLGADSWKRRLWLRLWDWALPLIAALLRQFWPIVRLGRLVIVTRANDVRYVLNRPHEFHVPYGLEMTELAGGENFVLGLEGCPHDWQKNVIKQVFCIKDGTDVDAVDRDAVAATSRRTAQAMIDASNGQIDVIKDLLTRIATEACIDHFGIKVDDPDSFAEWCMSISALLFADPLGNATTRQLALNGSARVRAAIDRSILQGKSSTAGPVLKRLLQAQSADPRLTDGKIRAILVGLVTGFIPTNTLAAGKILQELLRRRTAFDAAVRAARAAEKFEKDRQPGTANPFTQELENILFEAARLNPALAPGQWRYAPGKTQIISDGRQIEIASGSVVLVSTMSALRDVKNAGRFDPARTPADMALLFGEGAHVCLGKDLAMAQITAVFQVLLSQRNLKLAPGDAGVLRWTGAFPRHLEMVFDSDAPARVQQMLTICAPLKPGASRQNVKQMIADLDQPGIDSALTATGIVHFASLAVIEAGDSEAPAPYLILELNVDGTEEAAIQEVATKAQAYLAPIFAETPFGGSDLVGTFARCSLELRTRPWGATGLNYNGTGEFSVADIDMQHQLAAFARDALEYFVQNHAPLGNRAMPAVRFVRELIRQEPRWINAASSDPKLRRLLDAGARFRNDLFLPANRRLKLSDWVERTRGEAFYDFLKSRDFRWIGGMFAAVAIALGFVVHITISVNVSSRILIQLLLDATGGLVSALLLTLALVAAFVSRLRTLERRDVPDDRNPRLDDVQALIARENLPGYAQNHFMAVTLLKPGWFRKLTLALSLWGIRKLVHHAYRPGFVLNMGTIHYAKWFRLPKTDKLIFLSNFDGSWESYLEDFIMKAHPGQTAAWSNGVGFPKTNLLIFDGAKDGDRFKRWVRRQQVATQFWYSRFPQLTTTEIRNNAVIHQGLVRAHTDTAARSLLDCFGSMQQPDSAIETEEVQSLVFRGFKNAHYASYGLIELPDDPAKCASWLAALVPGTHGPGREKEDDTCFLTFGEHPFNPRSSPRNRASFVAITAQGLHKLGLMPADSDQGLATFGSAFNIGMHNRERILGDRPDGRNWRWADAAPAETSSPGTTDVKANPPPRIVHAIVVTYGDSTEECAIVLNAHRTLLGRDFVEVIHSEPLEKSKPPQERVFREHFGFRDGISQPVIKGTQRFSDGVSVRDVVEPGEFVFGYRNNQGYYPPAIRVSANTDLHDRLPNIIAGSSSFPSFSVDNDAVRDFGRNGSFLVVRQIEQHVETFADFTHDAARTLRDNYKGISPAVGAEVTPDWVAAKMMGRWRDGDSLVLRPGPQHRSPGTNANVAAELPDNDFTYAKDDPQGLRCPFGSHVRRSNPRDGLHPDDDMQQAITNRHRLLRRGRPYGAAGKGDHERGMVFTCLCADIERQFEFVQQTWIGSSSFHGLTNEIDPVTGWPEPKNRFTIPTTCGPMTLGNLNKFVTVQGGGYFFLPSRSAIYYLQERCAAQIVAAPAAASTAASQSAPASAAVHAPGSCTRVDA